MKFIVGHTLVVPLLNLEEKWECWEVLKWFGSPLAGLLP